MPKEQTLITSAFVLFLSLLSAMVVFAAAKQMPVFSRESLLESTWYHYKQDYLEPDSLRALDKQRDNITTSEGQSYTLLRSVWMDDKSTFDVVWKWTKDNLQHDDDTLLSWLFGQRTDGTYGILTDEGGENAATDADVDTALALLFASKRWNDNAYFGDAIVLIQDIWDHEVLMIDGHPYLLANDVDGALPGKTAVINPSYFSPYAYRIFAEVDPDHDWLKVVDTSYEVLKTASESPLDKSTSVGLPPDWVMINKKDGKISAPDIKSGLTTDYGYDAVRTPWRIALDAFMFDDPRALEALRRMGFLSSEWRSGRPLSPVYTHDGLATSSVKSHVAYAGALGVLSAEDSAQAKKMYLSELESLYDSSTFTWAEPLSYYEANWVWFGIALYNGSLRNLYSP